MKLKTLLFALILLAPCFLLAQGTVSGTLIDATSGESLLFANLVVAGTTDGVATDLEGKYQLELPAGTYALEASYTGYQTKTVEEVVVIDGEITYLDIALSEETELLQEVVVTAKVIERSENAMLLLQRKSDKIQDGISSQEMSRYSVGDAAGAMKRVTGATVSGGKFVYIRGLGDRYSLSQLNGLVIPSADPYRNSAQLDLIPTNLLENIITAKTFTPDQPGTFTGGNVDIKTKSFPEQFFFTVQVSGGYNTQSNLIDDFLTYDGGDSDYFGFEDGTRDLPGLFNDPQVRSMFEHGRNIPRYAERDIFYDNFVAPEGLFKDRQEYASVVDRASNALSTEFTPNETNTPINHGLSLSFGDQYQVLGNALGVILSASFNQQYQHIGGFQTANWLLQNTATGTLFNQGNFRETVSTQTPTLNGMLGLAYKLGTSTTITFNGLYNHTTDKIGRFLFGERPENIINPEFLEGRSLVWQEREMANFQLGGEHVIERANNIRIEWKASQAVSSQYEPDTRFFENQLNATSLAIDNPGLLDDPFEFYNNLTPEQEAELFYEIPQSNVRRPFHFFRNLEDTQQDYKLDVTIPITKTSGNKVKFGTLITRKERNFNEDRYQIEENLASTTFYEGDPEDYLSGDNLGTYIDENGDIRVSNHVIDVTEIQNTYEGTENVSSFYGMLTYNLTEKLKFIGGARLEVTDLEVIGADTTEVDSARIGSIDVQDLLPSINFVYALNDNMNLRASFSQTLARPNMREIAPFEAFDPLRNETYFGNPQLERTNIQNYDLRWEWFMNPGEVFAVSGYYKNFDNPITLFYRRAPNPEIQFTNVESAELYGLEFEFRKDLEEWIPAFRNLKFNTNVSFIQSSADVRVQPGLENLEPDDRPFEGQSPFILNAALVYSNVETGIDATLSLNTIGDRLRIIGREGTPDIYDRGRSQLDFTFIKKFESGLQAKLAVQNILDNKYVVSSVYEQNENFPNADGEEYIYSSFRQGVNFNISLAYTFR